MVEKNLARSAREYLEGLGWYVLKTAPPVQSGVPDLICCVPPKGLFVGIELKKDRNKPTLLQRHRAFEIRAAGGIGFCAWSMADIRRISAAFSGCSETASISKVLSDLLPPPVTAHELKDARSSASSSSRDERR